uniref:DM2 domain-containing protein n=1 Tax=viral metagenome TaxID=1070528 RepID=A0A6C0AY08_9ZZZZ|tara:strand:+ start:2285 stop:2944 length:660 start_codon:yes stop_codon:yes gene_type:complete
MVKKTATKQTTESVSKTPVKTATKTVKKTKSVEESTPAPVVVETVPETADPAPELSEEQSLLADYTNLSLKCQQAASILSSMKKELLALEKKTNRVLRTIKKTSSKRKSKSGNKQPSGFTKATPISQELAKFLGKTPDTEMARTDVTKEINSYIRAHKLQDPQNGRKINPDKALSTLLRIKSGDELTYFNLQRFMSPHFPKSGAALAAAAAAAAATSSA